MKKLLLLAAMLAMSCASPPPSHVDLPVVGDIGIIPQPRAVTRLGGVFVLGVETVVCANSEAEMHAAQMLASSLETTTNLRPRIVSGEAPERSIRFVEKAVPEPDPKTDGAYRLRITPDIVEISGSPRGLFYGLQSLLQVIPPDAAAPVPLAAADIDDKPRFEYRGMHLDVARHFMPAEFIKRYIDILARYKFNYFHWHLTDDQGWRIEIKQYPRLTEVGSKRSESALNKADEPYIPNRKPVVGFYSQEEIREIVDYARTRYVTIVPEIDMPGHASAALAAYPEYGCLGSAHPYKVQTKWGAFPDIMCPKEETFVFVENIIAEVVDLFPDSPYIHIGGDEVQHFDQWSASPDVRQLKAAESLTSNEQLVAYFIRRVSGILASRGRQAVGWDDVLGGGPVPDLNVMVWQEPERGRIAASLGHKVIMAPASWTYFDYATDETDTGRSPYSTFRPIEQVYAFDPVAPGIPPAMARNILGGQGCLWTEFITTEKDVEYMLLPRAIALAETLWSERDRMNFQGFSIRLRAELTRLGRAGINYRIPGPRIDIRPGPNPIVTLEKPTLDAVLHYTLDGSNPTASSALYTGPIAVPMPITTSRIRTFALLPDGRQSSVYEAPIATSDLTRRPSAPYYGRGGPAEVVELANSSQPAGRGPRSKTSNPRSPGNAPQKAKPGRSTNTP